MSALKRTVVDQTTEQVRVVYLDRETAKWWNARRRPEDTAIFCGWYWIRGGDEAGPFRSQSSAYRDAYYRFVLRREPPSALHAPNEKKSRMKRFRTSASRQGAPL